MSRFRSMLLASLMLILTSPSFAQRPQKTEIRTGTVKEIRQRGRSRTLIVNCDGEELSFAITPRVNVEVKLTGGDDSLIQRGVILDGRGTLSNKQVFLTSGSVRLASPGMKVPESKMEKPESLEPGESLNSQQISGLVMVRETSKEYPEYEEVLLRSNGNLPKIMFQKGLSLNVISSDIDDAAPDQAVELEVVPGRNDKLMLVRATIEGGTYLPPEPRKKSK